MSTILFLDIDGVLNSENKSLQIDGIHYRGREQPSR